VLEFPLAWFGLLAFFLFRVLSDPRPKGGVTVGFFIVLASLGAFGYFLMRKWCSISLTSYSMQGIL